MLQSIFVLNFALNKYLRSLIRKWCRTEVGGKVELSLTIDRTTTSSDPKSSRKWGLHLLTHLWVIGHLYYDKYSEDEDAVHEYDEQNTYKLNDSPLGFLVDVEE